jgi:hypothetical protein
MGAGTYIYPSVRGNFLSISGGTVTGDTFFTAGLTATTISANTIVSPGYTFNLIDNRSVITHTNLTAETIVFSQLIPANTLQTYDSLRFFMRTHRNTGTGNANFRWYLSSGATLPVSGGSEQIATYTFGATSLAMIRNMWISTNNTLQQMIRNQSMSNDESSSFAGAGQITATNHIFTSDTYFICSAQLTVSGDSVGIYGIECQVKRKSY